MVIEEQQNSSHYTIFDKTDSMDALRRARIGELSKVAEFIDRSRFLNKTIEKQWSPEKINSVRQKLHASNLKEDDIKRTINGGLLTYLLHW